MQDRGDSAQDQIAGTRESYNKLFIKFGSYHICRLTIRPGFMEAVIYIGPVKDRVNWRIRTNSELDTLTGGVNILRYI
jgi:hypothetical protein